MSIYDVKTYNRALTPEEIKTLSTGVFVAPCEPEEWPTQKEIEVTKEMTEAGCQVLSAEGFWNSEYFGKDECEEVVGMIYKAMWLAGHGKPRSGD